MKLSRLGPGLFFCLFTLGAQSAAWSAESPNFAGDWNVTAVFAEGSASSVLTLTESNGTYEGQSGPLDAGGYFRLTYTGKREGRALVLTPAMGGLYAGPVGTLRLEQVREGLRGQGMLFRVPVTLTAERPSQAGARREPKTHHYEPTRYLTTLSGSTPPALRIAPGDSVRTKTVDAAGRDEHGEWASMPGNPQTGPFYVEGAMPGDTLVVHLTRVRVNAAQAGMVCWGFNGNALPAGQGSSPPTRCSFNWKLDPASNTARPEEPSERMKNFSVPLRPMIGTIGVAPPQNQTIAAPLIGQYGGNLDYNGLTEGVTLYLPVYRAGALLSLGDAHAAQGDGEITGQGLESSMAVEFKVDLIKGQQLGRPWAEDDRYVMVSGIGHSLSEALQGATGGMMDWLRQKYRLEMTDMTLVLGTSIEYDVASVLGAPHVVAKLRKDVLARIDSP